MVKIPEPKVNRESFNNVKNPEVGRLNNETVVIRFFEYIEKKCGMEQLEKSQSKKVIQLFKQISENNIGHDYSFNLDRISAGTKNGYQIFEKFQTEDGIFEFKIGGKGRVFGFFVGGSDIYAPSFNVILITSDKHLEV